MENKEKKEVKKDKIEERLAKKYGIKIISSSKTVPISEEYSEALAQFLIAKKREEERIGQLISNGMI